MANRIVVDPVTRIEGHLRIEVEVKDGKVVDAYCSGTMVRGFELILKGRDPRDAWAFAERACGVCTTVHALASVRAVEDALGITVPPNAELIRNLMFCAQYLQDHVVHFYHLHALDWVDVVSALKADPKKTSELAQSLSKWPKSSPGYFSDLQKRLTTFVESGQLGIFANGYWGHSAYKLPPEVNLIGVAHYLEALEWQKEIVKVHTIFGGKNPHPNYLVGGVPCSININEVNAINAERLAMVGKLFDDAQTFVEQVYIPDLLAIAGFYKDWGAIGGGLENYMCYGDLPTNGYDDPLELQVPARHHPQPQPERGAAGQPEGPEGGAGVHHALLVRLRRRRRRGPAPLGRRNEVQLHRAEAAVHAARSRAEVLVAEDAALEGPRHGGRPAGADARRLCLGQRRSEGRHRRRAEAARRAGGGALLDARPHRGARHRDDAGRALGQGVLRAAARQHQARRDPDRRDREWEPVVLAGERARAWA